MARLLALVLLIIALADGLAAGLLFVAPVGDRVQIQREAGAWLAETMAASSSARAASVAVVDERAAREQRAGIDELTAEIESRLQWERFGAMGTFAAQGMVLLVISGGVLWSGRVWMRGLILTLGIVNVVFALTLQPAMRLAAGTGVWLETHAWAMRVQSSPSPPVGASTDELHRERAGALAAALVERLGSWEDDFNRPFPLVQGLALIGVFATMRLARAQITAGTRSEQSHGSA